ncbi:5'-methylthioadenosine nucleosidase [Mesomycoplasma hyorhinis]|uniref:phosphorylase family protein n=1 Tax=Mesomycoplasma hyorhinis TaxID=2100 RepID=UPI00136FFCF8|nr:5'-methylthioadenosine nucleosidase [Mesomycoplasma hyorhinis]MXR06404.1 5'-methylthioadenosine nucleosidase [Mesomycoplasma hyorhinis]MXR07153.1 5'-methylthioadenosine nucleosidase [Mesomycoplasma hyorhinis]MXR08840.1 5'-methylthioadenosine nucleosidase [Mesomycoplasma hyorhinis]MXR09347.1 5'-methylthioadenosine nucleosidase [Mesomycoplasma hyorhinis]UVT33999.1 5'-methylthioadenosine nucleosidase [Mesomycoplasma hyorhinis]
MKNNNKSTNSESIVNIAILFADELEFVDLKQFSFINQANKVTTPYGIGYIFNYKQYKIHYFQVAIGLINAAAACQYLIDKYKITQVYNYGAVGSNDIYLDLGSILYPDKIYLCDAQTPWYDFGQTPKEKKFYTNDFDFTNKNINLCSSNAFIYDLDRLNFIKKHINVSIFDMEAFALAHVCFKNKISFKTLKYVSDFIAKNLSYELVNNNIKNGAKQALNQIFNLL